jgi:Fe-S cluster assembly protein SufB
MAVQETVETVEEAGKYKYGFTTDIESDLAPKGLSEDIVRFISAKKNEPEWMLEWRLDAYRRWLTMEEPTWAMVDYPKIDFQDLHYYAAPKEKEKLNSLDEVGDHFQRKACRSGRDLLSVLRSGARPPRACKKISGHSCSDIG